MTVKMIQELGKRMEAQIKKINVQQRPRAKEQTEVNSTVTEMKNPVEEIKSRITGRRMHK